MFWLAVACAQLPSHAPTRLLVQPVSGVTVEQLDEIVRGEGARRVGAIEKLNVYIVELTPGRNADAAVVALQRHPLIAFAEFDARVPPAPGARAH